MSEQFFRHHVIRLYGSIDVIAMDADGDPHQHVLRTLNNLAINFQQVASLKGFETKILVVKIALINNGGVQSIGIFSDDFVMFLGNHWSWAIVTSHFVKVRDYLAKHLFGLFVQVGNNDPTRIF